MTTLPSEPGFKVGDKVYTTVSVGGETRPMAAGIITEIRSGYYMVDIMSLHGGAPWIVYESHPISFHSEWVKIEEPKC